MIVLSNSKEVYTVEEAAKMINKSEYTTKRYIRDGQLAATLIKGKYYTTEEAINACINRKA